jgi:conjugative relaxase-like TrwC/TraI family protein
MPRPKDGKERRSRRAGAISAPKSVSILSRMAAEAAHNRAVEAVIGKIEAEYACTRRAASGGGAMETVETSNLVMARFNHCPSRKKDPQLHSHIVVANLAQGADGTWQTIDPPSLPPKGA